jgi:hypothetical protein
LKYVLRRRALVSSLTATYERRIAGRFVRVETTVPF